MRFCIKIPGDLGESSLTLYKAIEYAQVNLTQLDDVYIYGEANNYVLADILNKCYRYSHKLQLNIY